MNISITQKQGNKAVTIIHLDGKLDSSSFQNLIDEAKRIFDGGGRYLILDMSKLTYISSAGIVSLHSIIKLFRGEALPSTEAGWKTIRSMGEERSVDVQEQVKLLNVPPEVLNVLDVVGFSSFFRMYTDLDQAIVSF